MEAADGQATDGQAVVGICHCFLNIRQHLVDGLVGIHQIHAVKIGHFLVYHVEVFYALLVLVNCDVGSFLDPFIQHLAGGSQHNPVHRHLLAIDVEGVRDVEIVPVVLKGIGVGELVDHAYLFHQLPDILILTFFHRSLHAPILGPLIHQPTHCALPCAVVPHQADERCFFLLFPHSTRYYICNKFHYLLVEFIGIFSDEIKHNSLHNNSLTKHVYLNEQPFGESLVQI